MKDREKRGRGRPRSFDKEAALERVLDVFWRKGLGGTSLDELAAAAGLNRPNLRAAFGDKQALYVAAMEHFGDQMRRVSESAITGTRPLRDELKRFFEAAIKMYTAGASEPRGCMVFTTAPAAAVEEPLIREALASALSKLDQAFLRRFEMACERGELPEGADPAGLSIAVSALLQSISIRARAGISTTKLRRQYKSALGAMIPEST